MKSTTHKISALCLILVSFKPIHGHSSELSLFFFIIGAVLGARAPDWLEMARWKTTGWWWKFDTRQSVIPHRTVTHWLAAWLAGFVVSGLAFMAYGTPGITFFLGLTATGLLHVTADWLTPMGVPILFPWKRHSLGLVNSNAGELVFLGICFAVVAIGLF